VEQLNNFLKELELLYKKYNISISHEDQQGAFIFETYKESNLKWLKEAQQEMEYNKILHTRANLSMFKKINYNTNFIQFCNGSQNFTIHRNYVLTIFKNGILTKSIQFALKFRINQQ